MALYMQKKNWLVKEDKRMFFTIKDLMLINSDLPDNFYTKAIKIANYL